LTAFILKRQVKKRRVAAGGFIGSAFTSDPFPLLSYLSVSLSCFISIKQALWESLSINVEERCQITAALF
jgi:hypothetical protein